MNGKYFNVKKSIFSKSEIEKNIPNKWKLKSLPLSFPMNKEKILKLENKLWYPLFLKPEWWQNSYWIVVIYNRKELENKLSEISDFSISYIAQKSANYIKEFEIFFIKDPDNLDYFKIISWVESKNNLWIKNCINGLDSKTTYHDILKKLSTSDINKITKYISELNDFRIWRIWLKANSLNDLVEWNLEFFEINIFIPFPLHLLDKDIPIKEKNIFIKDFTLYLAKLTKSLKVSWNEKNIFFPKMKKHYHFKLQHNIHIWK